MRTLLGLVLVLAMGVIGCGSDSDSGVSSQLAAFEASIAAAQAAADNAQAAATSAQGTADSASAAAASAQGTADSASAAASNAQGTATSAQNSANTAQDAADLSQSAAALNAEVIATLANNHRFLACGDARHRSAIALSNSGPMRGRGGSASATVSTPLPTRML